MIDLAEFKVLSMTPHVFVDAERKLVESTFVVFKDEDDRVGTIVIRKAKPTAAEVQAEVKKRRARP